jgi:hypothetical protein
MGKANSKPTLTKHVVIKEFSKIDSHWFVTADWMYTRDEKVVSPIDRLDLFFPELSYFHIMAQLSEPCVVLKTRWLNPKTSTFEVFSPDTFNSFAEEKIKTTS